MSEKRNLSGSYSLRPSLAFVSRDSPYPNKDKINEYKRLRGHHEYT